MEYKKIPHSEIVLLIEDNAAVRAYIREQLENDYTILEAADGEAGIALAIEAIPDLVISDVMMPRKDVAEICFATGFSDQANFTRSFKKQFGCSPLEYQKTHRE